MIQTTKQAWEILNEHRLRCAQCRYAPVDQGLDCEYCPTGRKLFGEWDWVARLEKESAESEDSMEETKPKIKHYTYHDNNDGGKIMFECDAKDILEADKMYQKETGKDVKKQPHIGCRFD